MVLIIFQQVHMVPSSPPSSSYCHHITSVSGFHRWADNSVFISIFMQSVITDWNSYQQTSLRTHLSFPVHAPFQKPGFIPKIPLGATVLISSTMWDPG